jgi:thiamine-phosphate pyrophosphorylase
MKLCAITDRRALGADEEERTARLVALAADWASGGVDFIQIREKDMGPTALGALIRRIVELARTFGAAVPERTTRILVNGSAAVALEAGADGVHLPDGFDDGAVDAVRSCFHPKAAIVSVACHSVADAERGHDAGADLILFAPVFGKVVDSGAVVAGVGLKALASACKTAGETPVFALGGVTAENAQTCIDAGAAGVAGIRLFVGTDWHRLVLP